MVFVLQNRTPKVQLIIHQFCMEIPKHACGHICMHARGLLATLNFCDDGYTWKNSCPSVLIANQWWAIVLLLIECADKQPCYTYVQKSPRGVSVISSQ